MDPVTLSLAATAGSSLASGFMAHSQGKAEQERANINADIATTRALQTDTTARQGIEDEVGSMRSVLAANEDRPSVGTAEIMQELRQTRDRERRINVGNQNRAAADQRLAGQNAAYRGRMGLLGGAIKAGPSLFDIYDYQTNKGA